MCGIAGVVVYGETSPPTEAEVRAMCDVIVHRGPDEEGLEVRGAVGLGMRRLSIIDVQGGHQPLYNEDRSVRLVFNGEIYNFQELRRGLEARGHRFRTRSDGEVVVHLWEEFGAGCLEHLNGMFALALHDAGRGRLLLARDRLGIKPLFWSEAPGSLVFASEAKALLAGGRVRAETDLDALGEFLAWEYVPAPRTLFRGVQKLEPGHAMEVDVRSGSRRAWRWWDVPPPREDEDDAGDLATWTERVDEAVGRCVRRELVSDVPLGAFLSGGVDSSLVVSHMGPARTFSIAFQDPSYNESRWAARVASHLGVSHRVETLSPDIRDLFPRLMPYMDDPIGDFSIFPTYLVSKVAREEVTVALSGDGGDELFGGYETYLAQEKARLWRRIPSFVRRRILEPLILSLRPRPAKKGLVNKARRFVEGLRHPASLEHARWRLFAGQALQTSLFTPEALGALATPPEAHIESLFHGAGARSPLDRRLYVDVKSYLVDNCLVKVDRMSMACSLEVRVPLLNHELVELAFQVPERFKVDGSRTKILLKQAAARHVPRECVYRPKEGFSIPIKQWLGAELRPIMEDLLSEARLRREGIFRADTVERLKREHLQGVENHSHVLWSLIIFQDWKGRWNA